MPEFWQKRYIDNQKVQVAGEIKRDICKYLVLSCIHYIIFYNFLHKWLLVANFLQIK